MDSNRQNALINALKAKETTFPCSRCGGKQFEVIGESDVTVEGLQVGLIGGHLKKNVQVVMVACSHCGHLWQHALGPLGMDKRWL